MQLSKLYCLPFVLHSLEAIGLFYVKQNVWTRDREIEKNEKKSHVLINFIDQNSPQKLPNDHLANWRQQKC